MKYKILSTFAPFHHHTICFQGFLDSKITLWRPGITFESIKLEKNIVKLNFLLSTIGGILKFEKMTKKAGRDFSMILVNSKVRLPLSASKQLRFVGLKSLNKF